MSTTMSGDNASLPVTLPTSIIPTHHPYTPLNPTSTDPPTPQTHTPLDPTPPNPPIPLPSSTPEINQPDAPHNDLTDTTEPPQSTHHMTTRTRTGTTRPKDFSDYHLFYFTKHPLKAFHTLNIPSEPTCYT
ncbi:uncharacterized mitochondrial protein AtMg00820-like [Fagus crenata]